MEKKILGIRIQIRKYPFSKNDELKNYEMQNRIDKEFNGSSVGIGHPLFVHGFL